MSSQQRVLSELEALRSMLDPPAARSPSHPPLYSLALNSAERSLDLLGRGIEAAGENLEMDALRVTGE